MIFVAKDIQVLKVFPLELICRIRFVVAFSNYKMLSLAEMNYQLYLMSFLNLKNYCFYRQPFSYFHLLFLATQRRILST